MKKMISVIALVAFLLAPVSSAFAASANGSVNATASIDPAFKLVIGTASEANGKLTANPSPILDFGKLTSVGSNALGGQNAAHAYIGCLVNSGTAYTVTQTFSGLVGAKNNLALPHSIGLTPISAHVNQSDTTDTGTLATTKTIDAIGTNIPIYTSDSKGTAVTIEVVYGYSGGNANGSDPFTGWVATSPTQAADTYNGVVTFTMTA